MADNSTFAERLSEWMEIRGLNLSDLSRMTGINKGQLSKYKNGSITDISEKVVEIIAAALNVTPKELRYGGSGMKLQSDADAAEMDISMVLIARLVANGYPRDKAEARVKQIMSTINLPDNDRTDAAWNLMDMLQDQLSTKNQ